MTTEMDTVPVDMPLAELADAFIETHHHGFPVLDEEGRLYGVVTIQDLEREQERGSLEGKTVRDIASHPPLVAFPDEPVWKALRCMGTRDIGRLPVVDRNDPTRLVGVIRRNDIIRAYQRAILRRLEIQERADKLRLAKLTGMELVEVEVHPRSEAAGKRVRDLHLQPGCLLISARRGRRGFILHGNTILRPGDQVIAMVDRDRVEELKARLQVRFGPRPAGTHEVDELPTEPL